MLILQFVNCEINVHPKANMSNLKVKANKLTEWIFNIHSVGESKKPVAVEVRLLAEKGGLRLRATCQDKLIEPIEDSDIERLHERVEAALEALGMGMKIEWLDYIQIQVHGGRDDLTDALYGNEWNACESVDLKADLVKYGIHPITQVPYILDKRGYPRVAVYPMSIFQGKPWDTNQGWKFTYIPATPENMAAIEDICARLGVLKTRLVDVLSQDNVRATLQNIANALPLLENKLTAQRKGNNELST